MDAELINIGTELLIGDQISSNQTFLVKELANIDVNIYCTNTSGFDPDRLNDLLSIALTRSDIILLVGGMGPNAEDITKQTVCEALGLQIVRHEKSEKRIVEYCNQNGIEVSDIILSMADMPAGSVVFRNDSGMCPGCAIRSSKQCIVMLPSSTVELIPMVKSYVIQYLRQLTDGAVFSQTISIFSMGITAHEVEERLGYLKDNRNPSIKCIENTGEVQVRVTAKTDTEDSARELAAPVIREILQIFGSDAYGMNVSGLEEVVVRELKDKDMTLSTAESCTAGIISKRITDISGASKVFELGAATYASRKKSDMLGVSNAVIQKFGAVSPEAAAAMAVGARRLAGSSLAVSTTGIAGPGGGTPQRPVGLVYIALADTERVWVKKVLIQKPGMDRDYIRQVAASHALNLVRIYVETLPNLMPGYEILADDVRDAYLDPATTGGASYNTKKTKKGKKSKSMYSTEPVYKKKKKKTGGDVFRTILFVIALLGFLGSSGYLLKNAMEDKKSAKVMEGLQDQHSVDISGAVNGEWSGASIVTDEDNRDPITKTLLSFKDLIAQNSDTYGWVTVPNTTDSAIDYVVVKGTDNNYYLKHDFDGNSNRNGTVFADYRLEPGYGVRQPNTIIYGHHMRSGKMFKNLIEYDNLEFYKKTPVIRFDTIYDEAQWVIFAYMKIDANGNVSFNYMRVDHDYADTDNDGVKETRVDDLADPLRFAAFINDVRKHSVYDTTDIIDVNENDELLMLSTCSYEHENYRTVVVARKLREGETYVDVSGVKWAENPVMPSSWGKWKGSL